jgi:RNA-directed DNA polymerase
VLCRSQEQAQQIKTQLAEWLAPRGLAFNEDKTKIVHLSQGFDFLGFNVRRYGCKLLIKPGKAVIKRVRERIAAEIRTLRGSNAMAVIAKLNPIIRGWAAYYRGVVSSWLFDSLDAYMWKLLYKWSAWSHPNKPKDWTVGRYFGKHNKFRNDRWVFGAPGTSAYVTKFAWTGTSSGMSWSRAGHHPMTWPWPSTGRSGARRSNPHWMNTRCACSPGRTRAAHYAGIIS